MKKDCMAKITLLIGFIILGGCTRSFIPTNYPLQNGTKTVNDKTAIKDHEEFGITPIPKTNTVESYPIKTVRVLTTKVPPPHVMVYKPMPIAEGGVDVEAPDSDLVIDSTEPFVLKFNSVIQREFLPEGIFLEASPDGKWIAYICKSIDSPTGWWLNVLSNDRTQQISIPLNSELLWFGDHTWLNSESMIFTLKEGDNPVRPYPMVVIFPFTGEQTELPSNYSGLKLFYTGPDRMQFNISDVVYDPTLKYVVYPEWDLIQYYVLWDRKEEKALAKIRDFGVLEHYPLWNINGTRFAVAASTTHNAEKYIEEWFIVSREGKVERFSRFEDFYSDVRIGKASWSHDGKSLAFWIETVPDLCDGVSLAILDISINQTTNTCIPGDFLTEAGTPLWSLDDRFLAFRGNRESSYRVYIVDVENWRAYLLPEEYKGRPIGWISKEQ